MICSYSKNFIFIKTQKTGSTSAEIVLSSLCNNKDFFTPIINYEELIQNKNVPLITNPDENLRKKYTNILPKTHMHGYQISEHMPLAELKKINQEFCNKAFKFCVERHPYEKIISAANHKIEAFNLKDNEFIEVINHIIDVSGCSDKNLYTDKNKIIVNQVVQYENLNSFLISFLKQNNKDNIIIPQAKKFKKHLNVDFLTKDQKFQIYNICEWEFKTFGYKSGLNFNSYYI